MGIELHFLLRNSAALTSSRKELVEYAKGLIRDRQMDVGAGVAGAKARHIVNRLRPD